LFFRHHLYHEKELPRREAQDSDLNNFEN